LVSCGDPSTPIPFRRSNRKPQLLKGILVRDWPLIIRLSDD